jgi:hypothetical protein
MHELGVLNVELGYNNPCFVLEEKPIDNKVSAKRYFNI